jgi:hypothetical protein
MRAGSFWQLAFGVVGPLSFCAIAAGRALCGRNIARSGFTRRGVLPHVSNEYDIGGSVGVPECPTLILRDCQPTDGPGTEVGHTGRPIADNVLLPYIVGAALGSHEIESSPVGTPPPERCPRYVQRFKAGSVSTISTPAGGRKRSSA